LLAIWSYPGFNCQTGATHGAPSLHLGALKCQPSDFR